MDLTPVGLTYQKNKHRTTYTHEVALSVVFETGVLHFADGVNAYKSLPAGPKSFLQTVPSAWDNSKLISGYPGKDIIVARKKGQDWYIAGINSEDEKKEATIALDFLGGGKYSALIIQDGKDAVSFASEEKKVSSDDSIKVTMSPVGGFAIRIAR